MTPATAAFTILFGGLLGLLGQMIRVVIGLKKLYEDAASQHVSFGSLFHPAQLLISLLMGFSAGALASLTMSFDLQHITRQDEIMLLGIGYAGSDFVEGFFRKQISGPAMAAAPGSPAGSAAPIASLQGVANPDFPVG